MDCDIFSLTEDEIAIVEGRAKDADDHSKPV